MSIGQIRHRLSGLNLKGTQPFNVIYSVKLDVSPRVARTLFAELTHHFTPPGNRRQPVFFEDEVRNLYSLGLKSTVK
jgi:hypothetical protein